GNGKEPGVRRSESHEVVYRGKELHVLDQRLVAVDNGTQEVPAELYVVIAKEPAGVSRYGSIFLVEICRRYRIAESNRGKTSNRIGGEIIKHLESCAHASFRMGRRRVREVAPIATAQIQDPWIGLVAQHYRVCKTKEQTAPAGVITPRGQTVGLRKRQEFLDHSVRIIHFLRQAMPPQLLFDFEEAASLARE